VITRARILLKATDGAKDEKIVDALGTSRATLEQDRRWFAVGGLDAVI
jgi:hypothetical protein